MNKLDMNCLSGCIRDREAAISLIVYLVFHVALIIYFKTWRRKEQVTAVTLIKFRTHKISICSCHTTSIAHTEITCNQLENERWLFRNSRSRGFRLE